MSRLRSGRSALLLAALVTVVAGVAWWKRQTIAHVCLLLQVPAAAPEPMRCTPPLDDPWARSLLALFILTLVADVVLLAMLLRRRPVVGRSRA